MCIWVRICVVMVNVFFARQSRMYVGLRCVVLLTDHMLTSMSLTMRFLAGVGPSLAMSIPSALRRICVAGIPKTLDVACFSTSTVASPCKNRSRMIESVPTMVVPPPPGTPNSPCARCGSTTWSAASVPCGAF